MARLQIPPIHPGDLDYTLPSDISIPDNVDAEAVCQSMIKRLDDTIQRQEWSALEQLFRSDAFLRDQIALSGTLRTFTGRAKVKSALETLVPRAGVHDLVFQNGTAEKVKPPIPGLAWIQGLYNFKTSRPAALCSGAFRLIPDSGSSNNQWKFWIISSTVESLEGHPYVNPVATKQEKEAVPSFIHNANGNPNGNIEDNTGERRSNGHLSAYDVVIIGAGQNGTQLGARLCGMGMKVLVIDKNAAAGDSWRLRYDLLCLHTPKAYGHPAYLPYSKDVPEWVPTARVADQYRALAAAAGVPVRTSTEVIAAKYDTSAHSWLIQLKPTISHESESSQEVTASFLVFAAGAGSQRPSMPLLPNRELYKGDIVHSSAYMNGKTWRGKKAIVIGTANSGHDMAQDLYLSGCAEVTLIQREKTFVIPREYLAAILGAGYNDRMSSEVSDRFAFGTPLAVTRAMVMRIQHDLIRKYSQRFDKLEAAGFKLLRYGDLFAHTLGRGGGHYVDIGCSELIADGHIKVKSGVAIDSFTETGLAFVDGSALDSDLILFATGFRDKNLRLQAAEIVGEDITDAMEDVWGLNAEGEVRGTWRPTGHPRFIIMAGDVAISRYYSHVAAIQIQEALHGLNVEPFYD